MDLQTNEFENAYKTNCQRYGFETLETALLYFPLQLCQISYLCLMVVKERNLKQMSVIFPDFLKLLSCT